MRKLTGILLLTCLLIPFIGVISLFQLQKYKVRKEVKWQMIRGLDKEALVLVKVGVNETDTRLKWKHAGEFELSGHMYDVVHRSVAGDSVLYYCFPDHAETRLNRQLTALLAKAAGQDPLTRDHQKRLGAFFKLLFSSTVQGQIPEIFVTRAKTVHPVFMPGYSLFRGAPPSPPPKIG